MGAIKPYRERVPKPLREINCAGCGIKVILKKGSGGKAKYCGDCKVIIYEERQRGKTKIGRGSSTKA